ncbi:MAG TPA: hypothetical protein VFM02_00435 [Candidatus Paceibacterota bacterium]|nr:hypothetical protein [Candidatus Paceibacterota bacterium]
MKNMTFFQKAGSGLIGFFIVFSMVFAPFAPVPAQKASASTIGALGETFTNGFAQCTSTAAAGFISSQLGGVLGSFANQFNPFSGGGVGMTVPVFDGAAMGQLQQNNATYQIKEYILDCLAWWTAKQMMATITDQTINWINGTDGSGVKFVTDYQTYFADQVNNASNLFINQLANRGLLDLNDPGGLQAALQRDAFSDPTNALKYTFPSTYNGFDSDFTKGGWEAYDASNQSNNNPFGRYIYASQLLTQQQSAAQKKSQDIYNTGSGFLNVETCLSKDSQGDCEQYQINTPGKLIESQLDQVLGSQTQQLDAADELNEVLAALFNNVFSNIFGGGNGLLNLTPPTPDASEPNSTSGNSASEDSSFGSMKTVFINEIDNLLAGSLTPQQVSQLQSLKAQAQSATTPTEIINLEQQLSNLSGYMAGPNSGSNSGTGSTSEPTSTPQEPGSPGTCPNC